MGSSTLGIRLGRSRIEWNSLGVDICRACLSPGDRKHHRAREMMFGTREEFTYAECADCGTLELLEVPENMAPYYAGSYYSFQSVGPLTRGDRLKALAHKVKSGGFVGLKNMLGEIYRRRSKAFADRSMTRPLLG